MIRKVFLIIIVVAIVNIIDHASRTDGRRDYTCYAMSIYRIGCGAIGVDKFKTNAMQQSLKACRRTCGDRCIVDTCWRYDTKNEYKRSYR